MKTETGPSKSIPRTGQPRGPGALLRKTVLLTALVPLLAGCVERQVVYRDRPDYVAPPPAPEVVVNEPPPMPPPQVEVMTAAPDPTYVWIGGNWEWRGRWVWAGGRWGHRPHPGAVWGRGHWSNRGGGRVWVRADWR